MIKKSKLFAFIAGLTIISILLFNPSANSQSLNVGSILPISNNINLIAYISIGVLCFLWGASSKYFRK
jgi:hypothetical protein